MYGSPAIAEANVESGLVSLAMVDYWVSFAVSGTPNDGNGIPSTSRPLEYAFDLADWVMHLRNDLAPIHVRQ